MTVHPQFLVVTTKIRGSTLAKESQHSLWRAFSPKMGKYSRISPYRQQNSQVLTVDLQATPLASVSIGAWLPLRQMAKCRNVAFDLWPLCAHIYSWNCPLRHRLELQQLQARFRYVLWLINKPNYSPWELQTRGWFYCQVWLNCPLCGVFSIACVQTGTRLVSVVRSRGVSAIRGLLMYWNVWRNIRDTWKCPLYRRCPPLRGVC